MEGTSFKKLLSLLLCVIMALSAASALAEYNLPKTEVPVSYRIFGLTHNNLLGSAEDWEVNRFWTRLEEYTGIDFVMETVVQLGTTWREQMNLAFASNTLPDVFFKASFNKQDEQKYGKDGQLIDLTPYITPELMPNLSALMVAYPDIRKGITTTDGKIYALPEITLNKIQKVTSNWTVDTVWMDKLGIQDPTTIEELYQMLVAFRDNDPNGNDKKDEYGISIACKDDMNALFCMLGWFGMQYGDDGMYLDPDTDKIIFAPAQNEFKQMLEFARKLYAEGLLDPQLFTQTNDDVKAKNSDAYTVAGMTFTNSPGLMCGGLSQLHPDGDPNEEGQGRKDDYKFLLPIMAANGHQIAYGGNTVGTGKLAVTNVCQNVELLMQVVDFFYSEEGGMYFWGGEEGTEYMIDEDGKLEWILPDGRVAKDGERNDVRKVGTLQPGGSLPCLFPEKGLLIEKTLGPIRAPLADYAIKAVPAMYFTDSVIRDVASITADLKPYIAQYAAAVVTGTLNLEGDWDAFQATMKNMGAEQLLKLYNEAYDTYSAH